MTSIELTSANFFLSDTYLNITHPNGYAPCMCDEDNTFSGDIGLPLANTSIDNNDSSFFIDSILSLSLELDSQAGKKRGSYSSTSDSPCKRFKSE